MTGNTNEKLRALFLAFIMVVSVVGMTAALGGSAAAQIESSSGDTYLTEGDSQVIIDGSANQSLNRISINDSLGAALGGGETVILLPDGVTVNESQSNIYAFTDSSNLEVTGTSVSADGSEITVTHDGNSQVDDHLRVRDIVVDVAPNTVDTDGANLDLKAETQAGTETYSPAFTVYKPALKNSGGPAKVAVGATGETLDTYLTSLTLETQNTAGQIGNQTNVVLTVNKSEGITWDTSIAKADVISSTTDITYNESGIEITETDITIPITQKSGASSTITFDTSASNSLAVNTTGDATTGTEIPFEATVEATESTGVVDAQITTGAGIQVQPASTTVAVDSGQKISVAKSGQSLSLWDTTYSGGTGTAFTDSAGTGTGEYANLYVNIASGEVGEDTNVTFVLNDSNVEFNTDATVEAGYDGTGSLTTGSPTVNPKNITVNLTGGVPDGDLGVWGVELNVSKDAALDDVEVAAQFQSSSDAEVIEVAASEVLTINEPTADFNGNADEDVYVDNDGIEGETITQFDITANSANQISDAENVTISLPEGTGLTFDTSADTSLTTGSAGTEEGVTVSENAIEIDFSGGALSDTDTMEVETIKVNATSAAAGEVITPEVTSYTGDYNITYESDSTINVSAAKVSNVVPASDDNNVVVNTGSTGTVTVESSDLNQDDISNTFGGANVELSLQSQPDDTDYTIDDVINKSTLTTASDGTADFNFSASATGEYVIDQNASESANATTTYTVTSGEFAEVQVEGVEDAFRGGASNADDTPRTGVYKVTLLDSEGNQYDAGSVDLRVRTEGDIPAIVDVTNDLNDDGTTNDLASANEGDFSSWDANTFTYDASGDDGVIYVIAESDISGDVNVEAIPRGDTPDPDPDTGTATFFNSVDSVNVNVEESLYVGDSVNATATATTSDGTQITVPHLGAFSSDASSVLEVSDEWTTDTSGEAVANVTALDTGTANLTATIQSVTSDSVEVTVDEPSAEFNVSYEVDNTSVEVNETVTVTATVENTGTAAGTADVTFSADGEQVDSTTTDSIDAGNNTTVEFTTSFEEAGTHNVTVNDLEATDISVGEDAVVLDDPATNLDDDGQLEDVNGNEEFDIGDVQALYANQDSDAVQNNVEKFDFNDNGGIDIGDVQALYVEYQNSS